MSETALQVLPESRSPVLSSAEVRSQINVIQDLMKSVMQDGSHFGKVPGCGEKPTLLQPGAQKLMLTFRLIPKRDIEIINLGMDHREVRVTTRLYTPDGDYRGEGVGTCSTKETRYRYRNAALKCPECGKETIIKGKKEYGGGWLCYAKLGGCGAKWKDGAVEIEGQEQGKVEHPDPSDYWNTVEKIACKRADVHATICTLAASDIFTQDIEDSPELFQRETAAPRGHATGEEQRPEPSATAPPSNGNGNGGASHADPAPEPDPKPTPPPPPRADANGVLLVTQAQLKAVFFYTKKLGHDEAWLRNSVGAEYGVEHLRDLTEDQASQLITVLKEELDAKGGK